MSLTRKLEIAGMAGTFKLRFRDVANFDTQFRSICGGKITVSRSPNGSTYIVNSDTDHFRVFLDIVTPNDLILWTWDDCTAFGWWILDGFRRVDFVAGDWPGDLTPLELSQSENLGKPRLTEAW